MSERKFRRGLSKPGTAAQARETVSQAVRQSTLMVRPNITEPIDYEAYVLKNRTILQNDPQRELLMIPLDDFAAKRLQRRLRTTRSVPLASQLSSPSSNSLYLSASSSTLTSDSVESATCSQPTRRLSCPLHVRECCDTFTRDWNRIDFKYEAYSGNWSELPKIPKVHERLQDQVYEIDDDEDGELDEANSAVGVSREGYILKGTEAGTDSFISVATKSFKRRYMSLRQEIDGTCLLEFYKDNKKADSKGTICLDFCHQIMRNSRRGKLAFELRMIEGHNMKPVILAAETEGELESWIDALNRAIQCKSETSSRRSVALSECSTSTPPSTPHYGTLRSLELTKNPELMKYSRETDYSISQMRKDNRVNVFAVYPDLHSRRGQFSQLKYQSITKVEPYKENLGFRFIFTCDKLDFNLKTTIDGSLSLVEPFFTTVSIFHTKLGKLTEEFRFNVNEKSVRDMITAENRESESSADNSDFPRDWIADPKSALFSVHSPCSPDLFLVVRIEKVLTGSIASATEAYFKPADNGAGKLGMKVHKTAKASCQRMGAQYRMPFAWACKQVFKNNRMLDTTSEFGPIYRQDGNKISDEEIVKHLNEMRASEKPKNVATIPGRISVTIKPCNQESDIPPNVVTTCHTPVVPFTSPPTAPATVEVQEFLGLNPREAFPFTEYVNLLYIFPKTLKYDAQKIFPKARNIAVSVEFRDSDSEGAKPLRVIFARPGSNSAADGELLDKVTTCVLHHNSSPDFYEEIKVMLPATLTEKQHILFTFYHVSCTAKKKDAEKLETPIGFAWLQIYPVKGRLALDEQTVSVATHIPPGYLSYKPLGLGRGFSGPEIKWVDGGKEIFRVSFKLVSSIFPIDSSLHSFLFYSDKMLDINRSDEDTMSSGSSRYSSDSSDPEKGFSRFVQVQHGMPKILKSLVDADISNIVRFFPILITQLLRLLVTTTSDDVAQSVVKVLVHILHSCHEVHKEEISLSYVEYFFTSDLITAANSRLSLHEELIRSLVSTLRSSAGLGDASYTNNLLAHCWFFFQITIKSMANHLLSSGRIKMHRHERFPKEFQEQLLAFMDLFLPHIMEKYHELPGETKSANQNLAYFLGRCMSLMDRGFVFRLIKLYLDKFHSAKDSVTLHHYKFEFLALITAYEHHVPINLPLSSSSNSSLSKQISITSDDIDLSVFANLGVDDPTVLSDEFCRMHYTVGALLQEVKSSLSEVHQIRSMALSVLRNLLVKHSFDDRYQSRAQQSRIASLYFPFVSVILENINRIHVVGCMPQSLLNPSSPFAAPALSKRVSFIDGFNNATASLTPSPSSTLEHPSKATVRRNSSLEGSHNMKRDSSYLQMIAGTLSSAVTINGDSHLSDHQHHSSDPEISVSSKSPSPDIDLHNQQNLEARSHAERSTSPQTQSNHQRSHSLPVRFDRLNSYEVRDLLIIFSWIIKHVPEDSLVSWLQKSSDTVILQLLSLHELSIFEFKYAGRKEPKSSKSNDRAMTLPARITINDANASHETKTTAESLFSGMLEANLATEVGLVALDILGLITSNLKSRLSECDGDNVLMKKVFAIYLSFLQLGQSETFLKHLFAALRAYVNKFPGILFVGTPTFVGKLCFELLRCCSSRLSSVRSEASALLYLLMRSNFEFTNQTSMTRVHLQVIISVSKLLGDSNSLLLNNSRFQESLAQINNFASSDKGMQGTKFPNEVRELTLKIRTVLMATAAMREHENDSEMMLDLQHHLANSYAETSPALRRTWLESMAKNHLKDGNISEAAHCLAHIAALESEILRKRLGADHLSTPGPGDFLRISTNITRDEGTSGTKNCDDTEGNEEHFSEESLLDTLETTATLFTRAERYEIVPDVYKIMLPLHEKARNFEALSRIHKSISSTYDKIIAVQKSGKRILGRYYRVAFFGREYFDEEAGKEFVYKEPKVTSLPEISQRLRDMYGKKFGVENVKLIMSEKEIDEKKDIDPKYAYIQITYVHPHNHFIDSSNRITEFEKQDNNLNVFMFETPFSLTDPSRARSASCEHQCKKRTILTTNYFFPYVVKRIPVVSKTILVLSPIEVAIDEMESRVRELEEVINSDRPDLKRLQLKLQGSISVTVNAGPLAYARAFLGPLCVDPNGRVYPSAKIAQLKQVYREFVAVCEKALDQNEKMISSDQHEYHQALKSNFNETVNELNTWLRDDYTNHRRDASATNGNPSGVTNNHENGDNDNGTEDELAKRLSCQSFEIFMSEISGSSTA